MNQTSHTNHSAEYLQEVVRIASLLDPSQLEDAAALLCKVREERGRLFLLGVGGSAANCSHAVCDFRKLGGFEAYSPCDNVSELTARTNDEGWATIYEEWLKGSRLRPADLVIVLSVGGGDETRNVSPNLVRAVRYAEQVGCRILGIVSGDGGYTAKAADLSLIIPIVNPLRRTPHAEAFQSILLHLLISHPRVCLGRMTWESVQESASPQPAAAQGGLR